MQQSRIIPAMRALLVGTLLMVATIACQGMAPAGQAAQQAQVDDTQPAAAADPSTNQLLVPTSCPGADVQAIIVTRSPVLDILVDSPPVTIQVVGQDALQSIVDATGNDVTIL